MQEGGPMPEQVDAQTQQQSVDPAIQQISDFISQAIGQGQNAAEVVMSLVEQQVDQQTIGQALMMNGFEEDDIMALFQEMSQGQQPEEEQGGGEPFPVDELEQTPQQLTEDESMHSDDMSAEETQEPGMSMGKSGIEIKPENEGKFTRWAEARGMSVQEAASKVMSNTDEYPPAVVKMANFAKNAASWNKEYGGSIMAQQGVETTAPPKVDFNTIDVLQGMDPNNKVTNYINYNGQVYQLPGNDKDFVRINFRNAVQNNKITPLTNVPSSVTSYFNPPKKAFGGQSYAPGGESQNRVSRVNNVSTNENMHWQRAPLYMNPMAFETSNNDFSLGKAAAVAYGGYKDFLSGDDANKDGIKDGFFRDSTKKSAIRDANKGNYYNYKITQDANDPNKYAADNLDLYNASKNQGSLRTTDQYGKDVATNSRFNYNVDKNNYDFITSSRPIDERIYDSNGQKNAIAGKDYNYLANMDPATRAMIMGGKDDPAGVRMGIDEKGNGMSYLPGAKNPYEYNTYMGINKVGQSSMIPIGNNGQPLQGMFNTPAIPGIPSSVRQETDYKSDTQAVKDSQLQKRFPGLGPTPEQQRQSMFGEQSKYDALRNLTFRYGGDLDKAQFGIPEDFNFNDPYGFKNPNFGQTANYADTQGYTNGQPIRQSSYSTPGFMEGMGVGEDGYGGADNSMYNYNPPVQNTISLSDEQVANKDGMYDGYAFPEVAPVAPAATAFGQPKVERTNKFEGGLNRFLDSRGVQGYKKLSKFAVKVADIGNDWFRDQNVNQAKEYNFNNLVADKQYATAEDPFNKRGLWDTNTGTAGSEGDRTTGLYMSKYGGENKSIEVDSKLLAKLIAAGADIEIL
jgi:hypothetical protein